MLKVVMISPLPPEKHGESIYTQNLIEHILRFTKLQVLAIGGAESQPLPISTDRVTTYKSLRRQGYTGNIFIIVDNEDQTVDRYKELYGDRVIMFDKEAVARVIDAGDNISDRRAVVYARNAVFDIARELGLSFFLEMDDDYTSFVWKFTSSFSYKERPVKNLDRLFAA